MSTGARTFATREQLQATIIDGWKLGCGCLYLHVPPMVSGTNETFVVIGTDRSKSDIECKRYHR